MRGNVGGETMSFLIIVLFFGAVGLVYFLVGKYISYVDKNRNNPVKRSENSKSLEHTDCADEATSCMHVYEIVADDKYTKECRQCGHRNDKSAHKCTVCGKKLF